MSTNSAVAQLLCETEASVCVAHLDVMWECWLTHELNDCSEAKERAMVLSSYKNMRKFLNSI